MKDSNPVSQTCRRCAGSGIETEVGILPGIPPVRCSLCAGRGKQPVWAISAEGWEAQFRRRETEEGTPVEMQDMTVDVLLPRVRRFVNGR